jgi:hypothetical protein
MRRAFFGRSVLGFGNSLESFVKCRLLPSIFPPFPTKSLLFSVGLFVFFLSFWVFNLGSQLFFFFFLFFRFGKFFTLFFLSALFFLRDKKNRFYASVGAQVETNTQKKLSTSTRAFARAVEGTIDAALFDDRGRDEGCWCPRPFLGRRFRMGRTNARARQVFFFFIAT